MASVGEAQKLTMKENWIICEAIARHLGCGKHEVFNHCLRRLKEAGLFMAAAKGDEKALLMARGFLPSDRARRLWNEADKGAARVATVIDEHQKRPPIKDVDDVPTKMKLAFLFLEKMGSAEKAHKAIDLAAQAVLHLDETRTIEDAPPKEVVIDETAQPEE